MMRSPNADEKLIFLVFGGPVKTNLIARIIRHEGHRMHVAIVDGDPQLLTLTQMVQISPVSDVGRTSTMVVSNIQPLMHTISVLLIPAPGCINERRQFVRLTKSCQVLVAIPSYPKKLEALTVNLGSQGILIRMPFMNDRAIRTASTVTWGITLVLEGFAIQCDADVRHLIQKDGVYLAGLHFHIENEDTRIRYAKWIVSQLLAQDVLIPAYASLGAR